MKKVKQDNLIFENESMLVSEGKYTPKGNSCNCEQRIIRLENRIDEISLHLEEITSNLNLSQTKFMETYSKLVEEQKKIKTLEYSMWEFKELSKAQN